MLCLFGIEPNVKIRMGAILTEGSSCRRNASQFCSGSFVVTADFFIKLNMDTRVFSQCRIRIPVSYTRFWPLYATQAVSALEGGVRIRFPIDREGFGFMDMLCGCQCTVKLKPLFGAWDVAFWNVARVRDLDVRIHRDLIPFLAEFIYDLLENVEIGV